MSTLADLQAQLIDIDADVDNLKGQIAALRDQLAAGTPVTQEQLDALVVQAQAINDKTPAVTP